MSLSKCLRSIKIVDEDVDLSQIKVKEEDDDSEMAYAPREERPSVAAVIDERPNHLIRKDMDRSRWRTLQPSDSPPHQSKDRNDRNHEPVSHHQAIGGGSHKSRKRHENRDQRGSHAEDSDLSPPRSAPSSKRKDGDDDDLSPPRIRSQVPHQSSSRHRHDSDDDLSPPRPDPRSRITESRDSDRRHRRRSPDTRRDRHSRPSDARSETLGGKVAGLSDSKSVREEVKRLKEREAHLMQQLGEDALGKNAKTVVRDRGTGRVRDLEAEAAVRVKPDREEEERAARYKDWSQGLKQNQDRRQRLEDDLREMEKPLARYEDDEDREKLLKAKELDEDPMLKFVRRNKEKEKVRQASSRGELVFKKPVYSGPPPPPNRFSILPGHRWDGVDRSNGYERKLLDKQAERLAVQEEAYKWSTEDM